jgi:hypothetical protein
VDGARTLTDAETRLWGVHQRGDVLYLRPSGWMQLGAAAQIAISVAFLALLYKLGAQRQLLVGVAAAFGVALVALVQGLGTVIVGNDGLTVWWIGRRRIAWDDVASVQLVSHSPWWGGGWPPFDVVDVTLRDGETVTLWPTRSGPPVAGRPSPAAVQCGLLERYRATLAR